MKGRGMKVLFISHMPPPTTGIGSWTKRILAAGFPGGWEIGFVNSNMIGGRDPFKNTKIKLTDEIKRSFAIWREEKRALKRDPAYAVVHTNIPCTVFGMIRETVTAMIAKRYGKKFVLHCHCTVPNVVNKGYKRAFMKFLLTFCDGVIVLNMRSLECVQKLTKRPVRIIPNFVSENELADSKNREILPKIKNALFVGGVTPEKGCDTIIEAAKKLPDIRFHLVGTVSDEIRKMEISKNVVFYGNQSGEFVGKILLKSDVFLFLSRYFGEGFSVALTEAMGAGLPCIVTDWAANADMIENQGGLVIGQKDPAALINALKKLDDPAIREKASAWNIRKVGRCYTDRVILPQFSTFYEEITNSAKQRLPSAWSTNRPG